jgi:hypothetical protein
MAFEVSFPAGRDTFAGTRSDTGQPGARDSGGWLGAHAEPLLRSMGLCLSSTRVLEKLAEAAATSEIPLVDAYTIGAAGITFAGCIALTSATLVASNTQARQLNAVFGYTNPLGLSFSAAGMMIGGQQGAEAGRDLGTAAGDLLGLGNDLAELSKDIQKLGAALGFTNAAGRNSRGLAGDVFNLGFDAKDNLGVGDPGGSTEQARQPPMPGPSHSNPGAGETEDQDDDDHTDEEGDAGEGDDDS